MSRAKSLGSLEHFGWGVTEYLIAQESDLVQVNTHVTAAHGSGKAPKKIKPVRRPNTKTSEYRPKSIREMDTAKIFPI